MLTAFVSNRGPAASLPEMTCLLLFFRVRRIPFVHIKLLVEQGLSRELAFDKKAFKTFEFEFAENVRTSKLERRRSNFEVRTSLNANANFVTSLLVIVYSFTRCVVDRDRWKVVFTNSDGVARKTMCAKEAPLHSSPKIRQIPTDS